MLNVPQLDDLGFTRIFERARGAIPALSQTWTDFNYHDPGITLLHTFAWLTDMLHYYIDASGEAHRLKYLKLLGLVPRRAPARCVLFLDARQPEISVMRGTRVAAGNEREGEENRVVFETVSDYRARRNRLISLVDVTGDRVRDLFPFAGTDGGFARAFTLDPRKPSALYFGFECALEEETRFYIEVCEGYRRNPFEKSFQLSECVWECCADGVWQPAEVLEDETGGFLRSGFISLLLAEPTDLFGSEFLPCAHYLRCRLTRNEYDVRPRIGAVMFNCVEAVQTRTPACMLAPVSDGGEYVDIDWYVRRGDLIAAALKEGDSFTVCYLHAPQEGGRCTVEKSVLPGRSAVHFFTPPVSGQEILISIVEQDFYPSFVLGRTDGCAGQRFPFGMQNVLEMKIAILDISQPQAMRFTVWELCEDVGLSSFDERVFSLDPNSGEIVFGDGLHGLVPEPGRVAAAVHVKTSLLGDGNVLKGQVRHVLDPVRPEELRVFSVDDARGGQSPETSAQLAARLKEHLLSVSRAVSAQDCRDLVMRTPGLAIDLVGVMTMKEYCAFTGARPLENTVAVAVKPYSDDDSRPVLSENYRRLIREHLENYRLLTTDFLIVPARYVGVTVYGRIAVRERACQARKEVEALLFEQIDFTRTRLFGARILHAKIFAALEVLECVGSVLQLSFEAQGAGARRSERGDVSAPPDSLLFLRQVRMEYEEDDRRPAVRTADGGPRSKKGGERE